MRSFKEFVSKKEKGGTDWKKGYVNLPEGFEPPDNMKPVVQAFLDSGSIPLTDDISKTVTMPKKSLFLVGGPVRDFLLGKTPEDNDLATNAKPEQTALILHSAGFKLVADGTKWDLPFKHEIAGKDDKKKYYLKGRDKSGKSFVVAAIVNGEEFDIATFRKDSNTVNGKSDVDFVDNPHEDASRRDLTINAMYIELTKAYGKNNKLYDPTNKGYTDIHSGTVRTVGKAEDRFGEDKLRILRSLRFHAKYGKGSPLDRDIEKSIPNFKDLDGVAYERIRDEFLKGLDDKEIDPRRYVKLYDRFGLLGKVLPGVSVRSEVPLKLRDKKDRFLALAWMLQDNPIESVRKVLEGPGWSNHERDMVCYFLNLKEFDLDSLSELLDGKRMLGVTKEQIRIWVELFDVVHGGKVHTPRRMWAKRLRTFSSFQPKRDELIGWNARDDKGNPTGDVHPEIVQRGLHEVEPHFRKSVLDKINSEKLKKAFTAAEAS
jgi:hypothetical protein